MNKENQAGRCADMSPTSPPIKVQRLRNDHIGLHEVTEDIRQNDNVPLEPREYIGEKIIRIKQVWNSPEPLIRLEDFLAQMGTRF